MRRRFEQTHTAAAKRQGAPMKTMLFGTALMVFGLMAYASHEAESAGTVPVADPVEVPAGQSTHRERLPSGIAISCRSCRQVSWTASRLPR